MPTRDNRHMKPGPFQNLIDRAHAVGIDTTGYDTRSSSADRLRNRVVAAEQKRKADGGTIVTKRAVELAGIPTMGQTSTNREKVARDWMNYMLRYVNHLSGGDEPTPPTDRLTEEQIGHAKVIAAGIVADTR